MLTLEVIKMNDNEVMSKIILWMISEATNSEYIEKLKIILSGIENKKHLEEKLHPRYMSIVLLGTNLFPFKIEEYREMVKIL